MKMTCVAILLFVSAVAASFAEGTNTSLTTITVDGITYSFRDAVEIGLLPRTITVGGLTYSNVTWRTVTPATVSILHATGAASIPLEKLPPELQKRFGYDPQRAAELRAAKQKADADRAIAEKKRAELMAKCRVIGGDIIQVAPEGLLMETYSTAATDEAHPQFFTVKGPLVLLVGHPKRGQLADGERLQFYGYQDGTWTYNGADGASHTAQRWVYVADRKPEN